MTLAMYAALIFGACLILRKVIISSIITANEKMQEQNNSNKTEMDDRVWSFVTILNCFGL